ncbi:MAG: putative bifunctional diguanylate cyclase/phosphodiesterase [Acidobacteriaceae bacterium]
MMTARRYVRQNIISIAGGVLLVTSTGVAGLSVYIVMQHQMEALLVRSLTASLQGRVALSINQIDQSRINTQIIATRPAVIAALHQLDREPQSAPGRVFLQRVAQSFLVYGFTGISIHVPQGDEVARAGHFLQTSELQLPLNTPKPATLLWEGQFFLRTRTHVTDRQGQRVGSILTESRLPLLTHALIHLQSLGKTAELVICAPSGKAMQCILGKPDSAGVRSSLVLTQVPRKVQGRALPMSDALEGKTGVSLLRNYLQQKVVVAYAPIDHLGLGMELMVSQSELNTPITEWRELIGLLLVILMLVGMLLLRGMVTPLVRRLVHSERKAQAANTRLQSSEMRIHTLLDSVADGIIAIDEAGTITLFNPACERIFGYLESEVIGKNVSVLMPEPDRSQHDGYLRDYLETGESTILMRTREVVGARKDGTEFPLELHVSELRIDTGRMFIAAAQDISERRRVDQELRIAAIAFEAEEGILVTDRDTHILRVNRALTRLTGYSAEELIGRTPAMLQSGRQDVEFYHSLWETLIRDGYWQGEIWNRRKDGVTYLEWLTITAVADIKGQVTHYVGVGSDITLRKAAEEEIHRLAFYDPLTKLANRSLLWDRLQQAQAYNTRYKTYGAVLFIDLDNFKTLNDARGHNIGDLLLIEIAKRLQDCMRRSDTVARLGGDEFVAVYVGLSEDVLQAVTQAQGIGKKVLAALNQPYYLQGLEYHSSASIGISLFRGDEIPIEDLLKHADAAMYQAKAAGRNAVRFFDPPLQAILESRIALEVDLRQALPLQQLMLYYQLQVNESQAVVGAEVLLRWRHPERGLVLPMDFIPLAEDTGLIVPIGRWVLTEACAQLKIWQTDPLTRDLELSVNVSARQFRQSNFVDEVLDVLGTAGVDPRKLTLELTESLVMDNMADGIDKIQALRLVGIRFSLDDFGTGQSSLAHLRRLPLDQIKIDQSFVHDIATDTDPNDAAAVILQTIIGMAKNLGLDIIAEGVETEQQHDFLKRNGCHLYQGYLFGKPVPIEEFQYPVCAVSRFKHDETPESAP